MKKLNTALLVIGIVLLVWLVHKMDPALIWRELRSLGWGLLPFVLGEGAAEMIHTVAWRHGLTRSGRSVSWPLLLQVRFAGYAINYVTPASLGGEVSKATLLTPNQRAPDAVSGLLIEKVCFAITQLAFAAIGCLLFVKRIHIPAPILIPMLIGTALVAGGLFTFLLLQRHGKLGGLVRWITKRSKGKKALEKLATGLTQMDQTLRHFYRERPRDFFLAIAWHLVGFSVGVLQAWLLLHLLKQDVGLSSAILLCCLSTWFDFVTFAIPLNAGVLEAGRIIAAKVIGYSAILGFTYGVAVHVSQLFWVVFGLACYASLIARKGERQRRRAPVTQTSQPNAFLPDLNVGAMADDRT